MAAPYPTDYPFHVDNEGWPESVYAPPYPHEYYHDNGQTPPENNNNNYQYQKPSSEFVLPLAIRRHIPGSTDPSLQKPSPRNYPQPPTTRVTAQRNQSQPTSYSPPNRNHSPVSVRNRSPVSIRNRSPVSIDHDERPIKPMKDTSIYTKPSIQKKTVPPRKPPPPSPSPPPPPPPPKSILSSSRYEHDSFQSPPPPPKSKLPSTRYEYDTYQTPPPPPSRNQGSSISQRRPVRTDLIPRTPFGIAPQHHRPRQVVVEEYADEYDDDDEEYYPVTYVKHVPRKVVSYQPVSGMTTRELENYQMSKSRRIVRVRSPPVKRVIYRS